MKNLKNCLALLLVVIITAYACSPVRKGNRYFKNYDYANAIKYYGKAADRKNPNSQAVQNLAHSYRLLRDYPKAEEMYAKAVKLEKKDPIVYFYYGEMLRANGKMDEAKEQYRMYVNQVPDDVLAEVRIKSLEEVKVIMNQTPQYDVVNLDAINTRAAEFSPVYYKNGMVFVSERTHDLVNFDKYGWNSQPYLDMYYAESKGKENKFGRIKSLSARLNSFYHDGPISFDQDQSLAFFTRVDVTTKRDTAFVNRPGLYSSKFVKGSWTKPEAFFLNNPKYSLAHPALSPDGKLLFFSSDMPGGRGGKDIYVCRKDGDAWGNAVNLGPEVNTAGNELFPYFRKDGTLFFSSDGLAGIGGLDIFSCNLEGLKWTNVTNLGTPVNSSADDFGIAFENGGDSKGYFSSNRTGGKGSDDIYSFVSNGKFLTLAGKILLSQDVTDPAKNAKVMLMRDDGTVLKTATTDDKGNFKFDHLPSDQKYMVKLDESDPSLTDRTKYYMTDENDKVVRVTVLNEKGGKFVFQNLPADPNALPQIATNDVSIAGNLLIGENPSKPLSNTKVNLVNEKGEIIQTVTTNAFGAFVFTDLPAGQNFLVKVDATDQSSLSNSKIIITNKSGKELQTTTAGSKGDFKFQFLASDKSTMGLLSVVDADLRFDMKGKLLGPDKTPLSNSKINLVDEQGNVIQTVTTDETGAFVFNSLPADKNFLVMMDQSDSKLAGLEKLLVADSKGNIVRELKAMGGKFKFSVLPADDDRLGTVYVDDPWLKVLELKSQNQAVKKDSLTIIENIYYDYGKWDILPEAQKTLDKVVQVMKNDPDITIEISSHTDSRSNTDFNLALSQKRAKAAVDYILRSGIDVKRLTGVGYGESKLINQCKDGVECSEEEHAKNRRTEFRILRKQRK
jgi:outer membrane protein OmpA-like peptidoglycan-associated protein